MTDLNKSSFYKDVISHLEEIEALYEEYEFEDEEFDEDDEDEAFAHDELTRFINHIRDAKSIAEGY